MKRRYELELETLARLVLLRQLAGDALSDAEKALLARAYKSASLKRMLDDIKMLYESPEMLALLRERPNSKRFEELTTRAHHVHSRRYIAPIV